MSLAALELQDRALSKLSPRSIQTLPGPAPVGHPRCWSTVRLLLPSLGAPVRTKRRPALSGGAVEFRVREAGDLADLGIVMPRSVSITTPPPSLTLRRPRGRRAASPEPEPQARATGPLPGVEGLDADAKTAAAKQARWSEGSGSCAAREFGAQGSGSARDPPSTPLGAGVENGPPTDESYADWRLEAKVNGVIGEAPIPTTRPPTRNGVRAIRSASCGRVN
jgi:hypothetical protein